MIPSAFPASTEPSSDDKEVPVHAVNKFTKFRFERGAFEVSYAGDVKANGEHDFQLRIGCKCRPDPLKQAAGYKGKGTNCKWQVVFERTVTGWVLVRSWPQGG